MFDEVISGFRVARGGAQEREGVTPDLTMLGKVIGGGLPAAAYAGPRELMERVAPAGDVYQAGTLSGNPLATAAGLATLELLDAAAYERLERVAAALADGPARAAAAEAGVPAPRDADHRPAHPLLPRRPGGGYDDAKACDTDAHGAFCRAMLERGRVPAAVAVRGVVSLARPHRRARRANARGRARRRSRRWRAVSALARGGRGRRPRPARARRRRPRARTASPARCADADRLFVLEAVYEGYLMHYGEPRAFAGMDADLRLLAGDALYALGLSRLAATGRPGGRGASCRT